MDAPLPCERWEDVVMFWFPYKCCHVWHFMGNDWGSRIPCKAKDDKHVSLTNCHKALSILKFSSHLDISSGSVDFPGWAPWSPFVFHQQSCGPHRSPLGFDRCVAPLHAYRMLVYPSLFPHGLWYEYTYLFFMISVSIEGSQGERDDYYRETESKYCTSHSICWRYFNFLLHNMGLGFMEGGNIRW